MNGVIKKLVTSLGTTDRVLCLQCQSKRVIKFKLVRVTELFTPSFVYANAPLSPERPKTKRSYNFIYCDLVRDLKILNERHYEQCLKDSEELRECEVYLNPAHLEGLKKFLARNFLIGYCAFVRLVIIEISGRNSLGAVSLLLGTVAIRNRMSITALTEVLVW